MAQEVQLAELQKESKRRKKLLDDSRLANRHYCMALDTALRRCRHEGLAYFVPQVKVGALVAGEERYFLEAEEEEDEALSRKRSCIRSDELRRFELPRVAQNGVWHYPSLWLCIDTGTVGWSFCLWLFAHIQARGGFLFDPWHAEARDLDNAWMPAGMKSVRVEASIVLNCLIGPFDRAGHFRRFSECGKRMLQQCDHTDPIFKYLYLDIASALGLHKQAELGSEDHMQRTWAYVHKCPLFQKKGAITRLGRWFQHEHSAMAFFEWAPVMLLALLHMGLELGWWHHISETPLHTREQKVELLADPDDSDGELQQEEVAARPVAQCEELPRTVKESNAELEKKRRSAHGNLHFTALFLSRSRETRLWQAAVRFCELFRTRHGKDIVMSCTKGGLSELHQTWAWQGQEPCCQEMLENLASQGFAESMQLSGAAAEQHTEAENKFVLKYLLKFICSLLFGRLLTGFQYMYGMPFFFATLLRHKPDKVQLALAQLEKWWKCLQTMEEAATRDGEAHSFVLSLVWPRLTWVREQMVRLLENDWAEVGAIVKGEVEALVTGLNTTRPCELAFNAIRDRMRHHTGKQVGEVGKWQEMVVSKILVEHDRLAPSISASACSCAPSRVPQSCFTADDWKLCSLGEVAFDTLGVDPPPWPTPSPQTWRRAVLGWHAALELEGQMAMINLCWLSLLVEPNTILHGPDRRDHRGLLSFFFENQHKTINPGNVCR